MQFAIELVNHYGYIILFSALVLELIAFPLPGEIMMTYCGFLVYEAKMNLIISILMAAVGSALGITISYFAGIKLGAGFFHKYGSHIHLGPERLEKTSTWFKVYGNKLLILAYFIPGIRHITGYFSGITEIPYKKFALNAYLGAFIWTSTFISLGKILGPNWGKFHGAIKKYMIIGCLIIAFILIVIYFYRNKRTQIEEYTYKLLDKTMKTFKSMGKIRIFVTGMVISFLGFFALVIGLTQDYLANEFVQFDTIVSYLVKAIFTKDWAHLIGLLGSLTSLWILIPLTIITAVLIAIRDKDRLLEIQFLFIAIGGGEALQFILRNIYRRSGPSGLELVRNVQYTFPSNQSLISMVAYGFLCFIIIRHTRKAWLRNTSIVVALIICFFAGLNPIFFQNQYPSDVYAGYVFGGVWLTLNIILLEVYRILPKIQK